MAIDNTTRATVLKYEPNEFARIWRTKLIEHKYDIETSLLFGSQGTDSSGAQYTEGAVSLLLVMETSLMVLELVELVQSLKMIFLMI